MSPAAEIRRTKIVCTIGPATRSADGIRRLIEAGMDVARLNFSHGEREDHRLVIRAIRKASQEAGREIGILQDLGGPKIRLGVLAEDEILLATGGQVELRPGETGDHGSLPVVYAGLLDEVDPGSHILLSDGRVELVVREKKRDHLVCDILVGGSIQSRKGVNLPSSHLKTPALTEKDRLDLRVGLEEHVDFVALSFVRHESDLDPVLEILDQLKRKPMLVAKIEKPQALERLEKIIAEADAVMVARGDLGVEMPLEQVPLIQKRIIRSARLTARPVITATQMLTSMMTNPRPTRAEATDVANAILDGTDALMLSDETAVGAYPIEAVSILDRIARTVEGEIDETALMQETASDSLPATAAGISRAACLLARDLRAAAIVAATSSGSTARLVSRFRPSRPILGLTESLQTLRQLTLSWGVIPDWADSVSHTDQIFEAAKTLVMERKLARTGDRLVITAGVPVGVTGTTNLIKVMEL
ncbi:MAG: pyruvate kinase [Syntrophobacteraceae bacterium]|jgi:pyruvate kinase|nr:pyruvate kinase [Syntrophobacteraceae bacterium]